MRYLFLLLLTLLPVRAATNFAASVARADVLAAINASAENDTVLLPPGTNSWTSALVITNAITLRGAGIGQTVILDDIAATTSSSQSAQAILYWTTTAGKKYRLRDIEFRRGSRTLELAEGAVQFAGSSTNVVVLDCRWDRIANRGMFIRSAVYGVAARCDFHELDGQFMAFRQSSLYGKSWGDGSWETPVVPGSAEAWYVENCTISGKASDSFGGSRFVMRFSDFLDSAVGTHGTESSQRYRASRWFEAYGNTFHNPDATRPHVFDMRDGSGIIVSNVATGNYSQGILLNNYRRFSSFSPWGGADGTNPWDVNDTNIYFSGTCSSAGTLTMADGSQSWTVNALVGYTIRNLSSNRFSVITANTSTNITFKAGFSSNMKFAAGDSYEIRRVSITLDQPGSGQSDPISTSGPAWPNQQRQIVHQWGNTLNGSTMNISAQAGLINGRDYTNNVPHPTWVPLVYPHPLVTEVDGGGGGGGEEPPPEEPGEETPAISISGSLQLRGSIRLE